MIGFVVLEVVLGIISLNHPLNRVQFLSLKGHLPRTQVRPDETVLCAAARLLMDLTGIQARLNGVGWVELRPAGMEDPVTTRENGHRYLTLCYSVVIPESAQPQDKDARWVLIDDAPEHEKQLLYHLMRKV